MAGAGPPPPWLVEVAEGRRGSLVQRKSERAVWRVEAAGRTCYAKQGVGTKRREVLREAERGDALRAAGVPVASPLWAGEWGGAAWLVTEAAPGAPLDRALAEAQDAPGRRAALAAASLVAARLHAAGYRFPDLTAPHVFVAGGGATLIDVARARRTRGPASAVDRGRDLAALLFSLPFRALTRAERVRLVRDATGARGGALREVLRPLDARLAALRCRTRWRRGHAEAGPEVVEALRALRDRAPDPLFDALLDPLGTEIVRTLPDRENRRFEGPGGTRFFLKVYPPCGDRLSPALRERLAIDLFQRRGVPVNREAAYADDVERGSVLVVHGCAGAPLDDLLRAGVSPRDRRTLACETARLYRRMRDAGLRHRDAYACHLFAARDGAGFELRLIDMTRAGLAPFPRERWFVKDAAQLWHGVPRPTVSRTDAVRWLRAYFGLPRLDARARRFARRVAAKERRIAARQARRRG